MYAPTHFAASREEAINVITRYPFAMLVTPSEDNALPLITQVPLIFDQQSENRRLIGHLARSNPQARALSKEGEVLALFAGPNAYISPSWYESKSDGKGVVPTWNYVSVELTGQTFPLKESTEKLRCVNELSKIFEEDQPKPWKLSDEPEDYIQKMLNGIVAFSIEITKIEAKYKLSQNRSALDQARVIAGLQSSKQSNATSLAQMMIEQGLG